MQKFKPFILCFKCRGNVIDCKCVYEHEGRSEPSWLTQVKVRYFQALKKETTGMRFEFVGSKFAIDFVRSLRQRTFFTESSAGTSVEMKVNSTYPYTTVNILELDPKEKGIKNAKVFRTATVGCWHLEPNFSLETGRLRALRSVTRTLPKEMRPLVWDAYMSRKDNPPSSDQNPPESSVVAGLPPLQPIIEGELANMPVSVQVQ